MANAKSNVKNIVLIGEKFVVEGNLPIVLRKEGLAVTTIQDGWQAMTLFDDESQGPFHMIILGIQIKSMPAHEILGLLRSRLPKNAFPIICCVEKGYEGISDLKELEPTLVVEYPRSVVLTKVIKELLTKFFS